MKRYLSIYLAAVILGAAALAEIIREVSPAAILEGIVHFEGNDIRMRTREGGLLFVDPIAWPSDEVVVKTGMTKPDVIFITHAHEDHFVLGLVKKYMEWSDKTLLVAPQDVARFAKSNGVANVLPVVAGKRYKAAGIEFETVPAYFSEGDSHSRENGWVGYVLEVNGHRYYVTGDTELVPEMAKVRADALFPLLFGCGGNHDNAVSIARTVQPKVVVPVHAGGQEQVIRRYIAALPAGVVGLYYVKGQIKSAD